MDNRGSSSPPPSDGTVFTGALELPAGDRAAFVAQACAGDADQRARIEALLQAHREAPAFLKTVTRAAAVPADPAGPGDHIGRYKLLLKLGEGGCGVVYMAEQEEPVRRRVALKIIKAGMDTREVVARFEAERQALAMMDHPGIARVLDGGATASGRPYFVMELVRGVTITKYCNESTLPTRARLELFIQVCHAVQHAHQKGVIHRDIKPSNILVTLHDNVAAPKVIDFGIAKATHGRLTDATLFTAFAQFLGTPAYMSPEQAEMTGLDIDTRSDVYSLGVLLYELLTGRLPFDPKSLQNPSLDEVRRIIREVEPKKPSMHLDTLADADRRTIAVQRSTDPAKLRMLLLGDLDWIVLKALEKNRARRYETPAALADDITRHLQDEPVVARPPGALYRIGKFTRRHRVGAVAAAAVLVALVAGTIVSVAQAVRAKRAERQAAFERARAVETRKRGDLLLGFMLGELRTEVQKVGKLDLLELVGDRAVDYFASLSPTDLDDVSLLQQAKALTQIGQIRVDQTRYGDAMKSFNEAYIRASAFLRRVPREPDGIFERAQAEYWIGFVQRKQGGLASANEWFIRYRDSGSELVGIDSSKPEWQREFVSGLHNLAVLDLDRRNLEAARKGFLTELEMVEKMAGANTRDLQPEFRIADVNSWLATVAERNGELQAAAEYFDRQVQILDRLLLKEPANARWRIKLADALALRIVVLSISGAGRTMQADRERARGLFIRLIQQDPSNRTWLAESLAFELREGLILAGEGNLRAALEGVTEARVGFERLAADEPMDQRLATFLTSAWRQEAQVKDKLGRVEALEAAWRAVSAGERMIGRPDMTDQLLGEFASACVVAGELAGRMNDRDRGRVAWLRALEVVGPFAAETHNWRLLDPLARILALVGREQESRMIRQRLEGFGYKPVEPWPTQSEPVSVSNNNR